MSVASCLAVRVLLDRTTSLPQHVKPTSEIRFAQVPPRAVVVVVVGTVISLAERRQARARTGARARRAIFSFDLADPATYLAAERVERLPVAVHWQPAIVPTATPMPAAAATRRARELGLPMVWPERHPRPLAMPMRVAAYAAHQGRAAEFVLAATRLAFCGGFDLGEPAVFAEAVAAAGLDLGAALWAAGAEELDAQIHAAGRFLAEHGATSTPVVQVGRTLFAGEARLGEAAAALRGDGLVRTPAFR
jgi:2-hydroxychromene-2-carboxylate isomerase